MMKLIKPKNEHIGELINWFSSQQQLNDWSGRDFTYPCDLSSFNQQLNIDTVSSFVLVPDDDTTNVSEIRAFGQFYNRLGKCHLARLVVNPAYRGQGIAAQLMHALCELGQRELAVKQCSLFVLSHNTYAIKAYQKFGFALADYPEEITLPNCLYYTQTT